LAPALEVAAPDLMGLDELAGWHLEQAIGYRRELGREVSGELTEAASEHLHTAGLRARERCDVMAATNLLERARLLAPEADIRRARIGLDLAEQLIDAGEVDPVDELLTEAQRHPEADALTALTRLELMTHVRPPGTTRAIESQLPGMLEHFSRVGDERALARTHILACDLYWMKARATPATEELRLAAEHARKAKDEGLRERALASYVATLRYSGLDAHTISERLDAIERERPGPYLAAAVEMGRSAVAGLEGRADEARRLVHSAADRFRSLGNAKTVAGIEQDTGHLELSLGDPGAALEALQRSDAILARLGERSSRSTTQAFLAQAHWRLGSVDAALAALELAEELGGTEDVGTMIETHRVRAEMALAGGDGEAAERWARSAVDQAFATDALVDQAASKLALARVLAGLERPEEAVAEARAALELFLTRGDRPGANQTRALLNELHDCE
jgi:tetratricopeptide (TPR) repeat protein